MKAASIYLVGGYEVYAYHQRFNGDDDCGVQLFKIGYGSLFIRSAECRDVDAIISIAENPSTSSDKAVSEILKTMGIYIRPSRIVAIALQR